MISARPIHITNKDIEEADVPNAHRLIGGKKGERKNSKLH